MDRIAELEKALHAINRRIFGKNILLGSDDYFFIRETAVKVVGLERLSELDKQWEEPNDH